MYDTTKAIAQSINGTVKQVLGDGIALNSTAYEGKTDDGKLVTNFDSISCLFQPTLHLFVNKSRVYIQYTK